MTVQATAMAEESGMDAGVADGARQVAPALVHGEGCECTRCTGFQPGHELSVRHGAYSRRLLQGDADHLVDEIEKAAPDASSPVVALCALTMAQAFRAERALAANGESDDLKRDAHRWHARAESLLTRMGLLRDSKSGGLVNISLELSRSPEWLELQGRIIGALAPYPDVLDAVVVAISETVDA